MKQLLQILGINQTQAAELLGVNQSTVFRWCSGESQPPEYMIEYLETIQRTLELFKGYPDVLEAILGEKWNRVL